jgi:hypothetical protein
MWSRDGATFPSFQASNETVTLALPTPTAAGVRTGPWRLYVQHRSFNSYSSLTGVAPWPFGGYAMSILGYTF